MNKLPVIFRKEPATHDVDGFEDPVQVIAVFPTEVESNGNMTCYARIGQHGSCSVEWYNTTKAATPKEYASLLKELRQIYGKPIDKLDTLFDPTELVVYERRQRSYAK